MADAASGGMGAAGWLSVTGSLVSLWGNIESGRTARINAERQQVAAQFEAEQAQRQAGDILAISQRQAIEERRQGEYAASRALAVAAASGGGVSDPTIVNLISRTKGEATYRSSVALYQGEAKARQLRIQAAAGNLSGSWALDTGLRTAEQYNIAGVGGGLKEAGSLYAKYGMNGPSTKASGDSATISPMASAA